MKSIIVALSLVLISSLSFAQDAKTNDKLAVIWSSGDVEVATNVCLVYTHASKSAKWFNEVTLIVWGPSAKLLTENADLQVKVKKMIKDGVKVQACIACASNYGVVEELRNIGIEVKGMGKPLTTMLKNDWKVISF